MEYLKKAKPVGDQVTQGIRDTVSRILLEVEKEGISAIRRYSEQLDGWNPESFVVGEEEIKRATDAVDDELKGHIEFAKEQVQNFARLQKETLVDFENTLRDVQPGVVDQDVQPSEFGGHAVDSRPHRGDIGDVHRDRYGIQPLCHLFG